MGIHHCPLIVRSCKWLNIISFIYTLQDVLRCLGTHWHQWWDFLTLVNDIHQWPVIQWILFMLEIDTFIHMIIIVPSGFVEFEDYIFFMTPSIVATILFQSHENTIVPLLDFIFWFIQPINNSDSFTSHSMINNHIFHDPTTTTFLFHSSSTVLGKWRYVVF